VVSSPSNSHCEYLKDDDVQSNQSWTDPQHVGFAVYIDHPWWYRALILLLVSVLIVPTILMTRAALDSIATDLLTALITIISVRGMIFGSELTIHLLDIVIGIFFMAIMTIPLIKWAKE
jgi:hypothetical protein